MIPAIQTGVASGKSIGISAYLLINRTAAANASGVNASRPEKASVTNPVHKIRATRAICGE
jgi:hypothetical protein